MHRSGFLAASEAQNKPGPEEVSITIVGKASSVPSQQPSWKTQCELRELWGLRGADSSFQAGPPGQRVAQELSPALSGEVLCQLRAKRSALSTEGAAMAGTSPCPWEVLRLVVVLTLQLYQNRVVPHPQSF